MVRAANKWFKENNGRAAKVAYGDLVTDRYESALYDWAAEKKMVDPVLGDLSNLKNILKDNKELSMECML